MRAWLEVGAPTPRRVLLGHLCGVGLEVLLVLGAWTLTTIWSDRLPDPIAIHWGLGGRADGFAGLESVVRVCTVLGIAGIVATLAAGLLTWRRPARVRGWTTGLASVTTLAPASLLLMVLPNLDAGTGAQAQFSGAYLLVLTLPEVAAGAVWAVAARPGRRLAVGPVIPAAAPVTRTHSELRQRVAVRHLAWILLAVVAGVSALAWLLDAWAMVLALFLTAVIAWFSIYRYRVDDGGLTIRFGPVGPLRRVVKVDEIEGADVADMRPREWGGWGYRIAGSHAAVLTRRGPGARVRLAGNRSLTLSSPDANSLAGRVNGAVLHHWSGRSRP